MMQNLVIFLPLMIFFAGLFYLSRRPQLSSKTDFLSNYFLGDRALKGFVLAMTLVATYGSVSSFVSGPGLAWHYGLGWVVFAAPQIITGFFVLGVVGKKMALVSRRIKAVTVIDVVAERFSSSSLAVALSFALLAFFLAMMVGQFIGGAQLVSQAAGIPYAAGLVIFGLIVVAYTTVGGFRAVALTDTLCAILMLAGMFLLAQSILSDVGGLSAVSQTIAQNHPESVNRFFSFDADGALALPLLFSAWILVGFATVALPQSVVRCMAYKTTSDLHLAMIVSTVVCGALMIGMTLLGFLARSVLPDAATFGANTDAMIPYLIAHHMDPLTAGLTLIAPLAATMSTVSSLLIAASSAVIKDLYLRRYRHLPDKLDNLERYAKFTTFVLGAAALLLALYPIDIIVWINMFAFGGLEVAFLCPLVGGLFWKRATRAGAWASLSIGLAVYLAACLKWISLGSWHAVTGGLLASIAAFVIVSLMTPKGRPHEAFFPQ